MIMLLANIKLSVLFEFVLLICKGYASALPKDVEFLSAEVQSGQKSEQFATSLVCEPGETRDFNYESESVLWNEINQVIKLKADVKVECLGADVNGKFGSKALKYLVEVSNVRPELNRRLSSRRRRRESTMQKIGSFFRNAWEATKSFFKRLIYGDSGNDFSRSEDPEDRCKIKRRRRSVLQIESGWDELYDKTYRLPFEFAQLADGTIPEVRFSKEESDELVKNFKRHIVDAFATQLDKSKATVMEKSPLGEHLSRYTVVDAGGSYTPNIQSGKDAAAKPGTVPHYTMEKIVLVERNISSADIVRLPGEGGPDSFAMNDHEFLDVDARQVQRIQAGKMVASMGFLTVKFPGTSSVRLKRSAAQDNKIDIGEFLTVKTEFSLQLRSRERRSTMRTPGKLERMEAVHEFRSSSLISSTPTKDEAAYEILEGYRAYFKDTPEMVERIVNAENVSYLAVSFLTGVVDLEVKLNKDMEENSVTETINRIITKERIESVCDSQELSTNCHHFLSLLCKCGSPLAFETLISSFQDDLVPMDKKIFMASLIADLNRPTESTVDHLLKIFINTSIDVDLRGAIATGLGSMASRLPDDSILKLKVADTLVSRLEGIESKGCPENRAYFDVLEALGNLGHRNTLPRIIQISDACSKLEAYQVETVHSVHRLLSNSQVQEFLLRVLLSYPSCNVKEAVISVIDDEAHRLAISGEARWPRNGFNEVDNELFQHLIAGLGSQDMDCGLEKVIRYFQRKDDEEAEKRLRSIQSQLDWAWMNEQNEATGAAPRRRREAEEGGKLKCTQWENDESLTMGGNKSRSDNDIGSIPYKRKRCSTVKRFGPRRAGVAFQAGMQVEIQDKPSNMEEQPPYKLSSNFLANINFLGADFNVGTMNYRRTPESSRVYINVLGQSLVDTVRRNCDPVLPAQTFTTHVPLYDFTVWIVKFSLGVNLGTEMKIATSCSGNQDERFTLEPTAVVRAAGEAMGSVLMVRGGINIGGDFNYHLNLDVNPRPEFCISGQRGYDPMKVNVEAWYQLWDPFCLNWNDRHIWAPEFVQWSIKEGKETSWIRQECFNPEGPTVSPRDSRDKFPGNEIDLPEEITSPDIVKFPEETTLPDIVKFPEDNVAEGGGENKEEGEINPSVDNEAATTIVVFTEDTDDLDTGDDDSDESVDGQTVEDNEKDDDDVSAQDDPENAGGSDDDGKTIEDENEDPFDDEDTDLPDQTGTEVEQPSKDNKKQVPELLPVPEAVTSAPSPRTEFPPHVVVKAV